MIDVDEMREKIDRLFSVTMTPVPHWLTDALRDVLNEVERLQEEHDHAVEWLNAANARLQSVIAGKNKWYTAYSRMESRLLDTIEMTSTFTDADFHGDPSPEGGGWEHVSTEVHRRRRFEDGEDRIIEWVHVWKREITDE